MELIVTILLFAIIWEIFASIWRTFVNLSDGSKFLLILSLWIGGVYLAFSNNYDKIAWALLILLVFVILFCICIIVSENTSKSTKKKAKKVLTWEEQVAETRACVDFYFQENKVGDLRNIKDFLIENQCLAHGDAIWHEIVDEINQLVHENKIQPLAGNEHVWESQYNSAKIATKIIKLD